MKKSLYCILLMILLSGCSWLRDGVSPGSQIMSSENQITGEKISGEVPKDIEILYTDNGYSPKIITVKKGQSVHFINQSKLPMWTASDPHPVHTDYHDFDSGKSILPGDEYVYTFEKTGTHGYHNHEKSLHRGIVRVYDPEASLINIDKALPGSIATRERLIQLLTEDPHSIQTLFDTILADKKLSNDCHDISHDLGHRAYELFGFSGALLYNGEDKETIAYVDDICAGGYMHGVLEELFLNDPTLLSHPDLACQGVQGSARESCYHGVGHGIMFGFERDLNKSIDACRGMKQTFAQHRCYEGVYMELFWGQTNHTKVGLGWDVSAPLSACIGTDTETSPACFLYGHLGYLRLHKGDFYGAIRLCKNTGKLSEYEKNYCIKGIGITLMKRFTSNNLGSVEAFSGSLTESEKGAFYDGVTGYSLLSSVPVQKLETICSAMKVDKVICLQSLARMQ